MATIKLKVDIISAINDLTSDRNKRVAYKSVMAQPEAKREFGRRVIDRIIERTLDGKDKDGDKFAPYSKAYKKSLQFQIYGKDNGVNLKLTGAMQAAIDVLGVYDRGVTIGFSSEEQSAKAEGHITGANYLPVRDFWGISKSEKEEILKETIRDFQGTQLAEVLGELENNLGSRIDAGDNQISAEILFEEDFGDGL